MRYFFIVVAIAVLMAACVNTSLRDQATDYLALRYAASAGDEVLVRALLERGAPVEPLHIDAAGELTLGVAESNSPLQLAAEHGYVQIVRLILEHKPWVDHRCCDSPTALGYAASGGHLAVVRLLLKAGADPSIRSESGTPLEEARRAGYNEVVEALETRTLDTQKAQHQNPADPKIRMAD
jgi:ankyrin repeat protein